MYGLSDDFQQLSKEKEEAEQLLTEVCNYVWDVREDSKVDPQGRALRFLNQINGLPEWWATHKPKTEREEKLKKVAAALSLGGKATPDMMPVAERVLQALGL